MGFHFTHVAHRRLYVRFELECCCVFGTNMAAKRQTKRRASLRVWWSLAFSHGSVEGADSRCPTRLESCSANSPMHISSFPHHYGKCEILVNIDVDMHVA